MWLDPAFARPCARFGVFLGPVDLMLQECGARYMVGQVAERDDLPHARQTRVEETPPTPCARHRVPDAHQSG